MRYECITSMNQKIYNQIGSYMIDTWLKCWPSDSKLIVYAEDIEIKQKDPRLQILNFSEYCQTDLDNFSTLTDDPRPLRFARKGFSWLHAMENTKSEKLVWLDADLLFYKNINYTLLDDLLPAKKLIAFFDCYYQKNPDYTIEEYLDWKNRGKMSAESGFVIIDTSHKRYQHYVEEYRRLYLAEETHSTLARRYDGEICVAAARTFLQFVEDLSSLRTTNKTQTPLNRSKLTKFFTHHKGKVKDGFTSSIIEEIIKDRESDD